MKSVLFNIIATGKYFNFYAKPLIESIKKNSFHDFKKDFLVFTDDKKYHGSDNYISHFPWPVNTLMRFNYMKRFLDFYKKFNFVYYVDSDMLFNQNINNDLLPDSSGLVGVEHPLQKRSILNTRPSFEDNTNSKAFLKETSTEIYFQGCLFGGTNIEFIKLVDLLNENTNIDLKNNIIAKWHDESHLNHYFNTHKKPKILSSDYCWPEAFPNLGLTPKIIHLNKK